MVVPAAPGILGVLGGNGPASSGSGSSGWDSNAHAAFDCKRRLEGEW